MAGPMAEIVEDHLFTHLVDREKHPEALTSTRPNICCRS
jgi:hypothetical protein